MITKIGPTNHVNFQARLKIRKNGFEKLLKDTSDISKMTSKTSTSAPDLKKVKSEELNSTEISNSSMLTGGGSSLSTTGSGLDYSTGAALYGKSAHNPNSVCSKSVPEIMEGVSTPESINEHLLGSDPQMMAHSQFMTNQMPEPNGFNESFASTFYAGSGLLSQTAGSATIKETAENIIKIEKNIPS